MTTKPYSAGETVFEEGSAADFVAYVVEGEAEVLKQHGKEAIVIGRIRAGEYMGEMAAIEGRPHSATVRAKSPLTLEMLRTDEFLTQASENGRISRNLLFRLCARLRELDRAYATLATDREAGSPPAPPAKPIAKSADGAGGKLRLLPGSAHTRTLLASRPAEEITPPFIVGRKPMPDEPAPSVRVTLQLNDSEPFRLSRKHFSIVQENGGIRVHDLNSHLGTVVNGQAIGAHFGSDWAPLRIGENTIIAGGEKSPFVFRIIVER